MDLPRKSTKINLVKVLHFLHRGKLDAKLKEVLELLQKVPEEYLYNVTLHVFALFKRL